MQDLKLYGMKSHDYHVLMQQLLPVAIKALLPDHVKKVIMRVFFFNALCSKVVNVATLDQLQANVVETICSLKMHFLIAFFNVMVHLMYILFEKLNFVGRFIYNGCTHSKET